MKPLVATSLLPEFAAEHATTEAEQRDLAELFERLSALPEPDQSGVERGRARLMAAVTHSEERFAPLFDKLTHLFDLSAEALRAIFARAANEAEWTPGPLPWVSLLHFQGGPRVAEFDTGLVRLKKGMPFPAHRHLGHERVLILDGGYFDHDQHWYGPGDRHDMTEGSQHSLRMNADRDVLLAVVISGEIEVVNA
jgi:ChrR-like protein with cupin domain